MKTNDTTMPMKNAGSWAITALIMAVVFVIGATHAGWAFEAELADGQTMGWSGYATTLKWIAATTAAATFPALMCGIEMPRLFAGIISRGVGGWIVVLAVALR